MTKSEWRKQYGIARYLARKFPDSYRCMNTYKALHSSVGDTMHDYTRIFMSYVSLEPQKLTRTLIHQRMNARIVK
jgi:hypothetical protein